MHRLLALPIRLTQGCQLPDFSLRSQTFYYTADFSATFLYMLKTETFFAHTITKCLNQEFFCKSHHKTTSKQKKFCDLTPDKNWKSAPTQLAPPVPGQAYGLQ